MIDIAIAPISEFWIYIHDLGEEYFLHHDYWPMIPIKYQVKNTDQSIDVMVQKEIKISDENCVADEIYSYFGMYYPDIFNNTT